MAWLGINSENFVAPTEFTAPGAYSFASCFCLSLCSFRVLRFRAFSLDCFVICACWSFSFRTPEGAEYSKELQATAVQIHLEEAKALVAGGASLAQHDNFGRTPLLRVVEAGKGAHEYVEWVLQDPYVTRPTTH